MEVIEGATYDLISNDTNDLQGILFQDTRMKEASGVVLFDETYYLFFQELLRNEDQHYIADSREWWWPKTIENLTVFQS